MIRLHMLAALSGILMYGGGHQRTQAAHCCRPLRLSGILMQTSLLAACWATPCSQLGSHTVVAMAAVRGMTIWMSLCFMKHHGSTLDWQCGWASLRPPVGGGGQ